MRCPHQLDNRRRKPVGKLAAAPLGDGRILRLSVRVAPLAPIPIEHGFLWQRSPRAVSASEDRNVMQDEPTRQLDGHKATERTLYQRPKATKHRAPRHKLVAPSGSMGRRLLAAHEASCAAAQACRPKWQHGPPLACG